MDNEQYYTDNDDGISIGDESAEDNDVTINDINTIHEINAGQLNVDPKTGEEENQDLPMPTHKYNL